MYAIRISHYAAHCLMMEIQKSVQSLYDEGEYFILTTEANEILYKVHLGLVGKLYKIASKYPKPKPLVAYTLTNPRPQNKKAKNTLPTYALTLTEGEARMVHKLLAGTNHLERVLKGFQEALASLTHALEYYPTTHQTLLTNG